MENREYVIITDSSCDLPEKLIEKYGLVVLPLSLTLDGKQYANTSGEGGISPEEIYAKLRAGGVAVTSAVNTEAFVDAMTKIVESGKDILYIGFSSALSGTYSAGVTAAEEVRAKFPESKIYTVDSLCASLGEGMLVYLASRKKQSGMSLDELYAYTERVKLNICHLFTVDDLKFLRRGGRISRATAMIASILSIKPILHVDEAGRLVGTDKVRGRKVSLKELAERVKNGMMACEDQVVFISHGDCEEEAKTLAEVIKEKTGIMAKLINFVGPVIGAHAGPGVMAVFFLGNKR